MIHIRFFADWKAMTVGMEVQGRFEEATKNTVRLDAGTVTLVYTLAQAVQLLSEQGLLAERPEIRICDGYANIMAKPKNDAMSEVLMSFWVVQSGFYILEHNFPQSFDLMPLNFSCESK